MDPNTFPTKGNLIAAKNSLNLANMGYGLMDKKRNILIRELMGMIDEAKGIQSEIDSTFRAAYAALQKANIELGINYVQEIGASVPVDDRVKIKARSIMGTEIPLVQHEVRPLALTASSQVIQTGISGCRSGMRRFRRVLCWPSIWRQLRSIHRVSASGANRFIPISPMRRRRGAGFFLSVLLSSFILRSPGSWPVTVHRDAVRNTVVPPVPAAARR